MSIQPIRNLNSVTLIDSGVPKEITGWSYVAGAVHIKVCVAANEFVNKLQITIPDIICYTSCRKRKRWQTMLKRL